MFSLVHPMNITSNSFRSAKARVLQSRSYWLLAIGCAMVVALLGLTYTQARMNVQVLQLTEVNQKRIDRLDKLWMLVVDAEASALSFLLMRNDAYLGPYRMAAEKLAPLMELMGSDFPAHSQDHADFQILKRLVDAEFQQLGDMLSKGRVPVTWAQDQGESGKQLMNDIGVRVAVLKARRQQAHQHLEAMYLERVENIRHVGYALGLASLLLIVSLFLVQQRQVALRARIHDLLKTENNRLEAQVTARTRELSNLASHLTNAREAERQTIARELHDEMGSILTAAKMDAGWLRRTLGPQVSNEIQERMLRLIESVGSAITLMRRLVDDLQPPLLKGLGLVEALRSLGEHFQIDLPVEMSFPDHTPAMSKDQSLALFRIAQESLNNVRKYAKATQVQLAFYQEGEAVVLSIRDNGTGFDTHDVEMHGHGIAGMKHRTQMFQGTLTLRSAPGKGTHIEVRMPLSASKGIN